MKAVTLTASKDQKCDAVIAYNLTVIADPIAHGLANVATKSGEIEKSEVVLLIPNKSDKTGKSLTDVPRIYRAPSYDVPSVVQTNGPRVIVAGKNRTPKLSGIEFLV
jgi:hypothetical protein